jgi:hypothetical protein
MEMEIRNPGNFQSFLECPLYLHVIEFFTVICDMLCTL